MRLSDDETDSEAEKDVNDAVTPEQVSRLVGDLWFVCLWLRSESNVQLIQ